MNRGLSHLYCLPPGTGKETEGHRRDERSLNEPVGQVKAVTVRRGERYQVERMVMPGVGEGRSR